MGESLFSLFARLFNLVFASLEFEDDLGVDGEIKKVWNLAWSFNWIQGSNHGWMIKWVGGRERLVEKVLTVVQRSRPECFCILSR